MGLLPLFIFLSLIAEILGTVGGFGSSMFFVPIAGFFLDFHSVLGITAVFHLSSNVSKIALFRNGFDKRLLFIIGIPSVVFVVAGSYLTKFTDSNLLELLLGILLIGLSTVLLVFPRLKLSPTNASGITGGALSGLTAGLLGTGGAIRGITLSAFRLDKDRFIATSAMIDLAIDLSRSIVYFANGYLHRHDWYLIPVLLVVGILGTFLGKKILNRFSELQFRYAVLILILITGRITLVKQFGFSIYQ